MKIIISQFFKGIYLYKRALKFVSHNKLLYFFLFPLIFNLLIYYVGLVFFDNTLENLKNSLVSYFANSLQFENTIFNKFLTISLWLMAKSFSIFFFSFFGGYLTIIAMSPVFTYLSEKTSSIKNEITYNFNLIRFLKDLRRAILIAFRNIFVQFILMTILFIFGFFPLIGWPISILGNLLLSSYFYGFSFMDYSNERNRLSFSDSISLIRKNKGMAIGLGFIFYLCLFIPIVGGLVSSFLAIISVVSATIFMEESKNS